jgi:hypothetical protein
MSAPRTPRLRRRPTHPLQGGPHGAAVVRAGQGDEEPECSRTEADDGLCCRGLPVLRPEGGRLEPGPSHGRGGAAELRCGCGSLLARLVQDHLELKCRRCKRAWMIPVTAEPASAG